jgi:hypothetical protein
MTTNRGTLSGFALNPNNAETKAFSAPGLGQSYPRHYPGPENPLGAPLSIREVARLIGCSAWTVRQKFIPLGLPHLRSGPSGRLTFFSNQVVAWVLAQQQRKGGNPR